MLRSGQKFGHFAKLYNQHMRVRKFLHSCLLVEKGADRILFDPGKFSFVDEAAVCTHHHAEVDHHVPPTNPALGHPSSGRRGAADTYSETGGELVRPADFSGITAVIVTHSHPDHMDDEALKVIMENNPGAVLYGNAGIASALREHGLKVELFEEGTRHIGGFRVDAYEARHANIVAAEIPPNTAYIINERLLNPGDSYAYSLDALRGKFEVLALPVMAPWATELDSVGFAARMGARRVLPIHDGYAKDFFLRMRYDNYEKHFGAQSVKFERLERAGDGVEV
jgi:L-ascorbate metabolism protein UlaG (beta-lactamase superfamily)